MLQSSISPKDEVQTRSLTQLDAPKSGSGPWTWFAAAGLSTFFGGCATGTKVELDTNRLHYSEVTLKATFHHTPQTVRKAFTLIAEKKIKSTDYVTGEAPLSKLKQVLQQMLDRGSQIKTAIIPGH